jgi:RNase P subunit RPR2
MCTNPDCLSCTKIHFAHIRDKKPPKTGFHASNLSMPMRLPCWHCQHPLVITHSHEITRDIAGAFVKDLYTNCSNCQTESVYRAFNAEELQPPRSSVLAMARHLVQQNDMQTVLPL